ncbi:carbohydrate binding domain-containing protein [Paenibacillus sp. HB172176]|uniref:carbohydrate binding domain-containing protein n=1 Tax=Paenibacillus sp. HB172176 TaxID=2493690 RepID=UPI001438EDA4|nr:carbohydrate binding domain-containing protein [Paenibacillus sp. HB172176]
MMNLLKRLKRTTALLGVAAMILSLFHGSYIASAASPELEAHTGTHLLQAELKGNANDWAYYEQQVSGILPNTDYTFGIWVKGGGIVTMKVSSAGSTVAYSRPAATDEWVYQSVSFNSGTKSGSMTFSIVDSAATAFPQSTVAGTMLLDDAYFGADGSGTNLLQNASFEDDSTHWNKYEKDVFAVAEGTDGSGDPSDPVDPPVDTTVYTGEHSLQANLQGNSSNWAYITQQVTGMTAGTVYEMGMWVKGDGAATMKLSRGSVSGSTLTFVRQMATSDWTYWTADYTADSTDNLNFSIYDSASFSGSGISQADAQGIMHIDDVFFGVKGSSVNLLANPSFEAAGGLDNWITANNSSPIVFSAAEGIAENDGTGGPTEPPATEPPATQPPATEPPTTEPPATDPPDTNPDNLTNIYAGNRSLQAITKGQTNSWKTITQQVAGIAANTDYTFGLWMKGSGAVTVKTAKSSGENINYIRPKATDTWTYVTSSFNSGTYSGTITFTISDSAGNVLPQAEAAGEMYIDDVFFGQTDGSNLLLNNGFEEQLKYWGGDKGDVFIRYPEQSDNPPAEQYDGINNLGVYSWDRNPEGVTDFGDWIGRTPYLAEDFLEQNTWYDLEGGNRLQAWENTPYASSMLWAAYPFPKSGGSLAEAADGDYNDHYLQLGENLMAAGMDNATIRFGHEFNGGWYIWSVGNANDPDHLQKCEDFAEAFRQFVTTLRSIPDQHFKFVWNPSTSIWGVDLEAAFPGRDYVDFVGIDHYDQTWATSGGSSIYGPAYQSADPTDRLARQQLAWNAEVNDGNWGLNMIADFAADQGVPLGICEWGLALRKDDGMGGADNAYFIEKMHEWIGDNNVAWHVYFNVSASDGDHDLYDTVSFPEASAKFSELWNPDGAPDTSPAIEPSDIADISEPYVKIEGEDGVLSGPAYRYHGDPWASGGEFAVMYKAGNALTFQNANEADDGVAIVYQGWQSNQKASLYVNNVLVKANILFEEHGRSWSDSYGYVVLDDVQIPEGATVKLQINANDELDNFDTLKIDYLLLLGATGEYVKPETNGNGSSALATVSTPSRTSYTHSGVWSLTASIKGTNDTNGSSYSAQPTLTAGTSYNFGAWIKGSGRMALVIQNTTSWAEVLVKPFDATGEWQYVSGMYTPTATGKYNIKLGDRDNSGQTGLIYIDDVRLATADGSSTLISDDFEDGGAKWWHPANHFAPVDYSLQGDSDNAHSGSWAMKLSASEEGAGAASSLSPAFPLTAGEHYTFKFWSKGDADLSVRLRGNSDEQLIADESFPAEESGSGGTGPGIWAEKSFTVTPPASGDYSLSFVSDSSEGELYIDDLLLYAADSGGNNLITNSDFELGDMNWTASGGTFSIVKVDELVLTDGLIDELSDFGLTIEQSNMMIATHNAGWYGGDATRAARAGAGDGSLVYELPYELHALSIAAYGAADAAPITVAVSADGDAYQEIALTTDSYPNSAKNDLPLTVYESYAIPAGTHSLIITLPEDDAAPSTQLASIVLNANSAPVAATPDSGDITAGQSITLSTTESGAAIYYSLNGAVGKTLYTTPIVLDNSASITAWTEKEGKKKSILRTFTYRNADDIIVDPYGQIKAAEFSGKIHNDDEFAEAAIEDRQFLDGLTAPTHRDSYGGLLGSKDTYGFEATGYFHMDKLGDKSVMVDPLGNLYFNLAVNGTGYVDETMTVVNGREEVYDWLPEKTGEFATAYDGNGNFSFYVANLIRKTGQPFSQAQYSEESVDLVRSLGFTGLGAWSNAEGLPSVAWLPMPNLKIGDSGLFDIFHPDMESQMDERFQALSANQGNSELIGYMFANEMPYDKLKSAVPAAGANVGSKLRLVEMLQEKYGDIADFNTAWALDYSSFDALKSSSFSVKTELAMQDMDAFTQLYLDELYKKIAFYTRKYDPDHLVMGDRWLANVMNDSKLSEELAEAAGKYMDVLTYNYYTYDLNLDRLQHLYDIAGETPFIMTEFHYGDPTTGLTFAARMAEDEHEKGLMYRNYVEKAAASGIIVGANWFSFLDQAPTGRWFQGLNGEAGAIGLLNVAGRPYQDFLASISESNGKIYDLILGNDEPYQYAFKPGQVERASDKKLDVAKSDAAPVIGDFSADWSEAASAELTSVDLVLGINQTGIGSRMQLTWDEDYFYFRAHIDDPTPMESPNVLKGKTIPAANAYLWAGDAIELFFGPRNVNDGGSMQFSDSQILLAAAEEESGAMQTAYYWTGFKQEEQPDILMAASLDEDGLGYTIDAKIAFADIGITEPKDGTVIRYDMGFDEGGAKGRERQFYWNGVDGNSTNREKWGQIILRDEAVDTPGENSDDGGSSAGNDGDENGGAGTDGNDAGSDTGSNDSDGGSHADGDDDSAAPNEIDMNGAPTASLDFNPGSNSYAASLSPVDGKAYLSVSNGNLSRLKEANPNSVIAMMTPFGGYRLPTDLADRIPELTTLLENNSLTANDISFKVTLKDTSEDASTKEAVSTQYPGSKLIGSASYTIEILNAKTGAVISEASNFNSSISRLIRLPDTMVSADGSEVPYALPDYWAVWKLDDASGELVFIPHKTEVIDGVRYIVIASHTNSVYITAENAIAFHDVAADKWYTPNVEQAAAKGLVHGIGAGNYAPEVAVTRAQFTQMLVNLLTLPMTGDHIPAQAYSDVAATSFYYPAVMKARAAGLLDGLTEDKMNESSDDQAAGKLHPNQPITREEMAGMIAAAAAYLKLDGNAETLDLSDVFTDFDSVKADYKDDVRTVYSLKIMQGTTLDRFEPAGITTRAQAATVLMNTAKAFGLID